MRIGVRRTVCLALSAAVLTACSGSGPTAPAPAPSPTPTVAAPALLQLGDLPKGWQRNAAVTVPGAGGAGVCNAGPLLAADSVASAAAEFDRGAQQRIVEYAYVYPSAAIAQARFALVQGKATCTVYDQGGTHVTVRQLTVGKPGGDRSLGYSEHLTASAAKATADTVLTQVGASLLQTAQLSGPTIDSALTRRVAAAAVRRAAG